MNLKNLGFSKISRMTILKMLFVAVVAAGSTLFMEPQRSCAQDSPKTPCDPEYMDALEARAWLEAQREIAQNQNFIFKPDSVLEYSCFDYFLNEAASNFGADGNKRQFSETDRWDGLPEGFTDKSTDEALFEVVMDPMLTYLTANFNQSKDPKMGAYLNNRREEEYEPQEKVDGDTAYKCQEMQKVWKLARCMNFNEASENEFDGFFDFAYYNGKDPRRESKDWMMMCEADNEDRWEDARKTAFNEDQELFNVEEEITEAEGNGTKYEEDDIITHLEYILPEGCSGPAIPTGIQVERPDVSGGAYPERVCTNPGCTNQPNTTTCTASGG